jgi:transposase-like protein
MPKCPNCTAHTQGPDKEWKFGRFKVKMYKCTKCGNQFREYFKESTLQFVLSAHNGGLGKIRVTKETMDRHKTYQG